MVVFNEGPITTIKKLLDPLAIVKEFLMVVSSNIAVRVIYGGMLYKNL
jgi:hypothetical protein